MLGYSERSTLTVHKAKAKLLSPWLTWVSRTLSFSNHVSLEDESLYTAIVESEQKIPSQISEILLFHFTSYITNQGII